MESRKDILIVDDEPGFTLLLKMNLEKGGRYSVRMINDPLLVEDSLHEQRPDLVLLDMVMPGLDGTELSARIRADESLADIPVVFLSALVSKADGALNSVTRHGDRVLVGKPVDLKALVEVIESELNGED